MYGTPFYIEKKNPSTLYVPALERPEGVSQQDYTDMEEFQQRINAVSLERVKAYYRRLRYFVLHCSSEASPALCKYFTLHWLCCVTYQNHSSLLYIFNLCWKPQNFQGQTIHHTLFVISKFSVLQKKPDWLSLNI